MRIVIVGDPHGNVESLVPKIYKAGELGIQHVMVVGDFGLWTHLAEGHYFLDEVNEAARINNLTVYAIGGNHENWDHWNYIVENMPSSKGFALVRRRVVLAPKAHQWTWAGKTFVGAGGAVSVDKAWRLAVERGDPTVMDAMGQRRRATGPKTLWWPGEQLSMDDLALVKSFGTADYLLTHDCSNHTPWGQRLKPDIDSENHRRMIDEVIASVKPKMHFHGHMHEKYDWNNTRSHGFYDESEYGSIVTRTIGLENDKKFNSWGVLDVESGVFMWPSQVEKALQERAERKAASIS